MLILKIGGGESINVEGIIQDLADAGEQAILVHGANSLRDEIAEKMGTPAKTLTSISGYTSVYSDEDMIDIILMAYAGFRNKRIVECCQKKGLNAIGLSGIDGRLIQGKRNRGIRIMENGRKMMKHDLSGKPVSVNEDLLRILIENDYLPVLCIPIMDETGHAINSENDDIVRLLHETLGAQRIIQFIEAPGLLKNRNDETTLIGHISREEIGEMESEVEGRMKRKILSLRKLFERRPTEVILTDGRTEHPLRDALDGKGTVIR